MQVIRKKRPTVFALLIAIIFAVSVGCKKDGQTTEEQTVPTTSSENSIKKEAPTTPKETNNTKEKTAEDTPPKSDKKVEVETQKAAATENPGTPKPEEKPLRTVCIRACNKAQMCGKAGGSGAAECMQKCLNLSNDTNGTSARAIESFRAQEACADLPCEDLDTCVQRDLARRRQLQPVAAYAPEKASATCKSLCEHEQKCNPEVFTQLRKNMDICTRYCKAVLIGTDNAASTARTIMSEAIRCLGKSCDAFEACMR